MLFKKITSDRDPRDTVFREIRKEFRPYFTKAGTGLKCCAERYPKFLFVMMVTNIVLSVILCLTVFRAKPEAIKTTVPVAAPLSIGLDRILRTGDELRQTIRLKKQIDSLSKKPLLSGSDSDTLWSDLNKIKPLSHAH